MNAPHDEKPTILVTGCSGVIGRRILRRLRDSYDLVGFDVNPVDGELGSDVDWIECDMTEETSVNRAVAQMRDRHGDRVASVLHLAAYFDFSGKPSPLYRRVTVNGTRRLLQGLQDLAVEQFVFSSSLLVMESSDDGEPVNEFSPVEAEWDYPQSKLAAEKVIAEHHGEIPVVILRIAGVYDRQGHSIPISQHISRIYEKQLESYVFPGDKQHGQAFVHLDDLAECFRQTIQRRHELRDYEMFLIGEEDVMSYAELQEELGQLIHGRQWPTIRIPKTVAKAGAWVQEQMASSEEDKPFIKPWMIDLADQNYPVDIKKARQQLGWEPQHTLRETLPKIIEGLHQDPRRFYEVNNLPVPDSVRRETV